MGLAPGERERGRGRGVRWRELRPRGSRGQRGGSSCRALLGWAPGGAGVNAAGLPSALARQPALRRREPEARAPQAGCPGERVSEAKGRGAAPSWRWERRGKAHDGATRRRVVCPSALPGPLRGALCACRLLPRAGPLPSRHEFGSPGSGVNGGREPIAGRRSGIASAAFGAVEGWGAASFQILLMPAEKIDSGSVIGAPEALPLFL